MSNSLVKSGGAADAAKVSNCVSDLIHAFTNGLNIFKRLRDRRRKRKHRKHKTQPEPDAASSAELELSNSLRRGPVDIQESYENHYSKAGHRFAKGDAIAHASLAETLIKLNTGLVGIIAAFLNHDAKNNHLNLDYKSLTNLSDASRTHAVQSLSQLYQRLSQSQLHIYQIGACAQCGSMKHQHCSGPVTRSTSPRDRRSADKKKAAGPRSRSSGPTIMRLPVKGSNETQLVMIRPQTARKGSSNNSSSGSSGSSSSSSSTKTPPSALSSPCRTASSNSSSSSTRSPSSALSSPYTSPLGSPLPQYTPIDPLATQKLPMSKSGSRRRDASFDGPQSPMWPHTIPEFTVPLQLPPPKLPTSKSGRNSSPKEKEVPLPATGPAKRRMDKLTPSMYTFASDSTKLGEIPQRNWTTPWDYEEAERLNAEALAAAYPAMPAMPADNKAKPKKGLFKFMKRGSTQRP